MVSAIESRPHRLCKHFRNLTAGTLCAISGGVTLREFISKQGDETAARILGISIRAARSYREGKRFPRPAKAAQMVKRSKGQLTMDAIYG
jgi:hypothetical protein